MPSLLKKRANCLLQKQPHNRTRNLSIFFLEIPASLDRLAGIVFSGPCVQILCRRLESSVGILNFGHLLALCKIGLNKSLFKLDLHCVAIE